MTAHLRECRECAEELRELESTVVLLRRLPEAKVPPALAASVMARVREGEAERGGLFQWLRGLATPAFSVPLAAGLAGLVIYAGSRDGLFQQLGAESQPVARIAVSEPRPEPSPGPRRLAARPSTRAGAGVEARTDQADRRIELARAMHRRSMLLELARRGRTKEVALTMRGAGHPLSSSMASHFEDEEPVNVSFASWSPGH